MQRRACTCTYQEHLVCREYRHLLQLETDGMIFVNLLGKAMSRVENEAQQERDLEGCLQLQ